MGQDLKTLHDFVTHPVPCAQVKEDERSVIVVQKSARKGYEVCLTCLTSGIFRRSIAHVGCAMDLGSSRVGS
jgi:hypothetical protein